MTDERVERDGIGNRIDRDGWGRYLLAHPTTGRPAAWRRVTSWTRMLDDRFALEKWKMRQVAAGFAARPDLADRISGDRDNDDMVVGLALEAAGSRDAAREGTRLHALLARIDSGEPVGRGDLNESDVAIVDAYYRELGRGGLAVGVRDSEGSPLVERVVVVTEVGQGSRTAGLGGTCDRWFGARRALQTPDGGIVEPGQLIIADLKTGKSGPDSPWEQGSMARQLAAYRAGRWMLGRDSGWIDPPAANKKWGVIVHLNVHEERPVCRLFWVDLAAGKHGLQLCHRMVEAREQTTAHEITPPGAVVVCAR